MAAAGRLDDTTSSRQDVESSQGRWITGPGGAKRWVPPPPADQMRPPGARRSPLRPCGTTAAYARHLRANEVPCRACCDAHAERERWAAEKRRLVKALNDLSTAPNPPRSRGYICPHDGCWCMPLEECPACAYAATQEDQ